MARHGNYLDDILDWDYSTTEKQYYLASSYKLLDKIDITEVVNLIFAGKQFRREEVLYTINTVTFDMIRNRFAARVSVREGETQEMWIDRKMFSSIFDSLASTPGGQPFIAGRGAIGCCAKPDSDYAWRRGQKGRGPEHPMWYTFHRNREKRTGNHRASKSCHGIEKIDSGSSRHPS